MQTYYSFVQFFNNVCSAHPSVTTFSLDDIRNMKVQLMEKYTKEVDPNNLIKLKRPLKPEFKRSLIDKRYRAKNKDNINQKQRDKRTCHICLGRYTRANKYNHQKTTKHTTAVLAQIDRDRNRRYII